MKCRTYTHHPKLAGVVEGGMMKFSQCIYVSSGGSDIIRNDLHDLVPALNVSIVVGIPMEECRDVPLLLHPVC